MIQSVLGSVFIVGAIISYVLIYKSRKIDDKHIRRSLGLLSFIAGTWALSSGLEVLIDTVVFVEVFYTIGLISSLLAVLFWLYFASAFSDKPYHTNNFYTNSAFTIVFIIIATKISNSIHSAYYETDIITEPFTYVKIVSYDFNAYVLLIAYICSFIGFYWIYSVFKLNNDIIKKRHRYPLILIFIGPILTGYATLDLAILPALNYNSLGVVLALLIVYFVIPKSLDNLRQSQTRDIIDKLEIPMIIIDGENNLVEFNALSERILNIEDDDLGENLTDIYPEMYDKSYLKETIDIKEKSYNLTMFKIDADISENGPNKVIIFNNITQLEAEKDKIAKKNEQLRQFADSITHELRNTIHIADGHIEVAASQIKGIDNIDENSKEMSLDSLEIASEIVDRVIRISEDLNELSKTGRYDSPAEQFHSFRNITEKGIEKAFEKEDIEIAYDIIGSGQIKIHEDRYHTLIRKAVQFAYNNQADQITFKIDDQQIEIYDNGNKFKEGSEDTLFEYGTASPSSQTGSILPVIKTICTAHNLDVNGVTDYEDGAKYIISNLRTEQVYTNE